MSAPGTTDRRASAPPDGGLDVGRRPVVLLYALAGGVVWWAVHLVGLTVLAPAVCGGVSATWFTAFNVVCLAGVGSALAASIAARRSAGGARPSDGPPEGPPAREEGADRPVRFLATIAVLFNVASLALTVLESVPVYVLDACR